MAKKILGLDLGVSSIGWSLISEDSNNSREIIDMGCRIIPLTTEDKDEFVSGNAISKNQKRTLRRTQRKGYKRYQLRRFTLSEILRKNNMMPDDQLMKLTSLELYGLRDKALKERLELNEIGRIIYHLNQKRGYKSSRSDLNLGKKDTEYVAEVKSRHTHIKELNVTVGQYFFQELLKNKFYKIKQNVFPREAYIEEFDAICRVQSSFHPSVLTEQLIDEIRNDVVYFQRKLKSQKGLVSICELEAKTVLTDDGKELIVGPKVAPRSSPLFQLCKIWETVNTISLKVRNAEDSKYKWRDYKLSHDEKQQIVAHLNQNAKLTFSELLKILKFKKEEVYANKQIQRDLQGNLTYSSLAAIIGTSNLLDFTLTTNQRDSSTYLLDKKTGEVLREEPLMIIDKSIEREPLYQLWHTIYSIKELDECVNALIKRFGIEKAVAEQLAKIDFNSKGFGEKSNKAMRKILPYLALGYDYSQACSFAGYNHSKSYTNEEIEKFETADRLELLPKNSLRQPVVEKILNQLINLVNKLNEKYGKPDEIRVELARELKQSKEERNSADLQNSLNKKINETIALRLQEFGLPATKKYIQKYKFVFPLKDKKWNEAKAVNQCIYCGESFSMAEALSGDNFDVDHIVPKSLLFDDSQTNKVLVHRKCNAEKTNSTAFDFIASKGEHVLAAYLERVDDWFNQGVISYSKMQRLKVSYVDYVERKKLKKETEADKKLWEGFIDRQLRETAYISRKAKQLLTKICKHVYVTEGTVTAKLRKLWGWEDVLKLIQIPKYQALGLTQTKEWTSDYGKQLHSIEEIIDWSKRDDHRHHAVDALTVACTRQGFIQRINTLNASDVKDQMRQEIETSNVKSSDRLTLLEQYLVSQRPFDASEVQKAVSQILISFKPGKKVATVSKFKAKGKNLEKGVITPRGALSEESVYGKIKTTESRMPVKYLFENPHLIFKPYIRELVEIRIANFGGDVKKALASLKKEPIYLDSEKTKVLEYATCFKEEVVIKYPLQSLKAKDVQYIVDKQVREVVETRLKQFNNKEKEAFKNIEDNPVWYNEAKRIPIKTVRCFTGLTAVEAVRKDNFGKEIGFVKPGNNHHIAIYQNENGQLQEHVCSFWHAVERKKHGIPVIISNPNAIWTQVLNNSISLPQEFLKNLPSDNWVLKYSLQQNEMFVLGVGEEEIKELIAKNDRIAISEKLYRVQKISSSYYVFRHHLETELNDSDDAKKSKRFCSIRSLGAFEKENPTKVIINSIGEIRLAYD